MGLKQGSCFPHSWVVEMRYGSGRQVLPRGETTAKALLAGAGTPAAIHLNSAALLLLALIFRGCLKAYFCLI